MILKPFAPKLSPWGFKVDFQDMAYGYGQQGLEELLGFRRLDPTQDVWRWYMIQDLPWSMERTRTLELKDGAYFGGNRRKGRLYVFEENLAVLLKLMCQSS